MSAISTSADQSPAEAYRSMMMGSVGAGEIHAPFQHETGKTDQSFQSFPSESSLLATADDRVPTVLIRSRNTPAAEPPSDRGTSAWFKVTRKGRSESLEVKLSVGGSASPIVDYTFSGIDRLEQVGEQWYVYVTIPAGQYTTKFQINAVEDAIIEGAETVDLAVVASENYTIGRLGSASREIVDNHTWSQACPEYLAALKSISDEDHAIAQELVPVFLSLKDAAKDAGALLNIVTQLNLANAQGNSTSQIVDLVPAGNVAAAIAAEAYNSLTNANGLVGRGIGGRFVKLAKVTKTLAKWAGPASIGLGITDWTAQVLLTIQDINATAQVLDGVSTAYTGVRIALSQVTDNYNSALADGNAVSKVYEDLKNQIYRGTEEECEQLTAQAEQSLATLQQYHQQQTPIWQGMAQLATQLVEQINALNGMLSF